MDGQSFPASSENGGFDKLLLLHENYWKQLLFVFFFLQIALIFFGILYAASYAIINYFKKQPHNDDYYIGELYF